MGEDLGMGWEETGIGVLETGFERVRKLRAGDGQNFRRGELPGGSGFGVETRGPRGWWWWTRESTDRCTGSVAHGAKGVGTNGRNGFERARGGRDFSIFGWVPRFGCVTAGYTRVYLWRVGPRNRGHGRGNASPKYYRSDLLTVACGPRVAQRIGRYFRSKITCGFSRFEFVF